MTGHEDEAEQVVPELLVDGIQVQAFVGAVQLAADLFGLSLEGLPAPDDIDRAVLRGPHEPGTRPLPHTTGGPTPESSDASLLHGRPCRPDGPRQPSRTGHERGPLIANRRFACTMRF